MGVGRILNVEDFIRQAEKAIANGIPTLDASAKVPKNQISLTATDVGAVGTEVDPTVPALAKTLSTNNAVLAAINAAAGTIDEAKIPAQTWDSIASKPTTLSGFGITDAQPLGNELSAIQALVDTAGFLKKTGNGAYSIDTASYLTTETDPTVATFTKGLISNEAVLAAVNASPGLISASRLPSYVDDVLEFAAIANFPIIGETGKIYTAIDTNKIYRWSGSVYVEISSAGTSDAATKLATPRTISTTGDAVYSVSFDGSADVSGVITLASVNGNVGSFGSTTQTPVITVDAKGRITAVSAVTITPAWGSLQSVPANIGFLANDANNPPNFHAYMLSRNYGGAASWTPATINSSLENTLVLRSGNGSITAFNGVFNGGIIANATTPSTSPTTGASIVAGGQGVSGDQHVGGFSSFGGVASGHPATKKKLIEGFTPGTEGTTIGIAHGLDATKIVGISFIGAYGIPGYWMPHSYGISSAFELTWETDLTNIYVTAIAGASVNVLFKTFRVLIEYIA